MKYPVALAAMILCAVQNPAADSKNCPKIQVFFSPDGGCTEAVVKALEKAKKTVFVQAYSFTSAPIAKALVDAQRRGVQVKVILDKSQETQKYSSATFLVHEGVSTLIDFKHPIAHNKIMIIDQNRVVTGSFNFTREAEKNGENLLLIDDAELAATYTSNWKNHQRHAEKYNPSLIPPSSGTKPGHGGRAEARKR